MRRLIDDLDLKTLSTFRVGNNVKSRLVNWASSFNSVHLFFSLRRSVSALPMCLVTKGSAVAKARKQSEYTSTST